MLPPDSDDDLNEESGKRNEPSNKENDSVREENELWNEENDLLDEGDEFADSDNRSVQRIAALEDLSAMILDARFKTSSNREPGKVYNEEADRLDEQFEPDNWAPFDNEKVYRFAEWIIKHRISQTAVNELQKSPVFQGNHTFTSAYAVFKKIDKMTYELGMQTWKSGKVSLNRSNARIERSTAPTGTPFFYRNPVTCIQFLLRQMAYKETITYAPVKEYNEQNERVYLEIHTGDWWWHMQVFHRHFLLLERLILILYSFKNPSAELLFQCLEVLTKYT